MALAQAPPKTALALVCRFWNAVVESTPTLWTKISISDTIPYVRKSLLKSGELSIDVYGAHPDPGRTGFVHEAAGCQFLQEVNCHARRWRHVTLPVMSEEGYAPSITSFPFLESLELHSKQYSSVREEYVSLLNKARTPYLREALVHTALLMRWDISFPPTLSKLEIQNFLPSPAELLSVLAGCPNLTVLRLGDLFPRDNEGMGSGDAAVPAVELAALQELELHDVSAPKARALLAHLRLPEDCAISLGLRVPLDLAPAAVFWTPALSLYHKRFQRTGQIHHVTAFVTLDGLLSPSVRIEGWRWVVNLSLHFESQIIDALEWSGINPQDNGVMPQIEPSPIDSVAPNNMPIITLEVVNTNITNSKLDHLDPIRRLQCITRIDGKSLLSLEAQYCVLSYLCEPPIVVRTMYRDVGSELNAQGDPAQNPSVFARTWAFPCLRELVLPLPEARALNALLDYAQSRWTYDAAPS
ncbi:hypothetical protein FRC01_013773, partial [Tulasnella sp. 417]